LDNIYSRLGRPENASGYDISVDGNLITEEIATEYADMAHKLRLTPEQANGVLEYYRNSINQSDEQMQQVVQEQAEQTTAELQREWGRAFEQKVALAREVVDQFAGSEILQLRLDDGTLIGNHPAFIKAFAAIGDFKSTVTSEDTISDSAMNRQFTPAQAQAEVDAMLNDKSHAYWDRKNPVARERAVQRMQDLMAMIHD
jgi:uncharacterized protein GlcG (DUF336 family)